MYFSRASGRVTVRTSNIPIEAPVSTKDDEVNEPKSPGICFGQIVPKTSKKPVGFDLIRNAADEAVLRVDYGGGDAVTYGIGKNEIIEIKPTGSIQRINIAYPVEYVVAPGFVGDDLIFKTEDIPNDTVVIPAENMVVGLRPGGRSSVVVTWPGNHDVTITKKGIRSISVETLNDPVFVAAFAKDGIW